MLSVICLEQRQVEFVERLIDLHQIALSLLQEVLDNQVSPVRTREREPGALEQV